MITYTAAALPQIGFEISYGSVNALSSYCPDFRKKSRVCSAVRLLNELHTHGKLLGARHLVASQFVTVYGLTFLGGHVELANTLNHEKPSLRVRGGGTIGTVMKTRTHSVLAVLAFLLTLNLRHSTAFAQIGLLPSGTEIKKVTAPVYLGDELQPVAIIRADHVFGDYQRRGFFRIGVLPMLVLDGLSLELCDTTRLSTVLTNVSALLNVNHGATRVVEGRNFSLLFPAQKKADVRAQLIRLQSKTEWRLQDGVVHRPDGTSIQFRRATLRVAGPESGELTCDTAQGAIHIQLLSLVTGKGH